MFLRAQHIFNIFHFQLVEKAVRSNERGNGASVQMEIDTRQRNINKLGSDIEKLLAAPEKDETLFNLLTRKLKHEDALLKRAKENSRVKSERERERKRRQLRQHYFAHADIISTTLSSSMSRVMQNFFCGDAAGVTFGQREGLRPFSICIVDEASQCVEPEALIPLKLGFSKLVLVGDPEQLPATVLSLEAKQKSFAESLFKRLFKQLETVEPSPVLRLTDQYRMHPEIAQWPNAYFYGGMLKNGPQNRSSFLKPYLLLDLESGYERQSRGEVSNEVEARFISKMAVKIKEQMAASGQNLSIAIITFYSSQQRLIRAQLRRDGLEMEVHVHSVDSFQGSEADVVIISCVRTNMSSIGFTKEAERFNVALTRAKFSLLVVGNFDAFMVSGYYFCVKFR
jgi:senataxin